MRNKQTKESSQTVMIWTEIRDILRANNLAQKKTGEHDEVKSEWMLVAMVIDRYMLFTFIIFAFVLNVFLHFVCIPSIQLMTYIRNLNLCYIAYCKTVN